MADTGINYAGSLTYNDFNNPNNALGSPDSYYATSFLGSFNEWIYIQLVVGGTVTGDNNNLDALLPLSTPAAITFGSSTDKWGLSLSPADINASDFGIYVELKNASWFPYLKLTNYSFSVPSGATIDGIEAIMTGYYTSSRGNIYHYIDSVGIKVYYTAGSSGIPKHFLHYAKLRSN